MVLFDLKACGRFEQKPKVGWKGTALGQGVIPLIYAQTGPLNVVGENRSVLIINSAVAASASITNQDRRCISHLDGLFKGHV